MTRSLDSLPERSVAFDLLRVIACIGVVAIHTEVITSSPTNYLGGLSWWFANILHSFAIISVPLFVLISGALVLRKQMVTYRYVVQKIIVQFLLPFVFWWLVYTWWSTYRLGIAPDVVLTLSNLFFLNIGPLYFVPIIMGLYGVAPRLHGWLQNHSYATQLWLAIGTMLAAIVYKNLSWFVFHFYNQTTILLIFLPYLPYFLWGYLLARTKVTLRQWWLFFVIALGMVGINVLATYYNTLALNAGYHWFWTPTGGNFFWEPLAVPVVIQALAVFVIMLNIHRILPSALFVGKVKLLLTLLAKASFGVYLIHSLVLDIIDTHFRLSIQFITSPLWMYYLGKIAIVFSVSAILVLFLQRLNYVDWLVGKSANGFTMKS